MAGSELPFPTNTRTDNSLFGGARFGRKKRTIFILLLVAVFFVLWFNSGLDRLNGTQDVDTSKQTKDDTLDKGTFLPSQDSLDEVEDVEDIEENKEVTKPKQDTVKEAEEKPTTKYTPPTTIYKTTPQHFKYFMVIASRATNLSRRQLIRDTYFGLHDNVEPCMKRDKGLNYLFWVYGDVPASKTPERRLYETEKMEYNDLEKVDKTAYNQDDILRWVKCLFKVVYCFLLNIVLFFRLKLL